MKKLTLEEFKNFKPAQTKKNKIKIGMSTCGIAAGADLVFKTMENEIEKRQLDVSLEKCGCAGMCAAEPLVEVIVEGMPAVVYGKVNEETAHEIITKHVIGLRLINDHIYQVKSE